LFPAKVNNGTADHGTADHGPGEKVQSPTSKVQSPSGNAKAQRLSEGETQPQEQSYRGIPSAMGPQRAQGDAKIDNHEICEIRERRREKPLQLTAVGLRVGALCLAALRLCGFALSSVIGRG